MENPIINFSGKLISLGPLSLELCTIYHRWNNDFITTRTLAQSRPVTLEEIISSVEDNAKSVRSIFFTIYENTNLSPIGFTYLDNIDFRNRTAEFNIVIGEEDYRGKGFGTETTKMVLDYAFTILGLHNVMLKVYEFNKLGIRAYQKAGFVEIGRRRQSHFMRGRFWDVIYMDCIASEFKDSLLK